VAVLIVGGRYLWLKPLAALCSGSFYQRVSICAQYFGLLEPCRDSIKRGAGSVCLEARKKSGMRALSEADRRAVLPPGPHGVVNAVSQRKLPEAFPCEGVFSARPAASSSLCKRAHIACRVVSVSSRRTSHWGRPLFRCAASAAASKIRGSPYEAGAA